MLASVPAGAEGAGPNIMMDAYAAQARLHMATYGTTQRQIAAVAAKNHAHSVHNPLAQYRNAMSIEEVLAAPPVAWPLTAPMCAPDQRRRCGGDRLCGRDRAALSARAPGTSACRRIAEWPRPCTGRTTSITSPG